MVATNAIGDSVARSPQQHRHPGRRTRLTPGRGRQVRRRRGRLTGIASWKPLITSGGQAITGYRITAFRYRANGTVASRTESPVLSPIKRSYNMRLPGGNYRFTCTALDPIGAAHSPVAQTWSPRVEAGAIG